jgi:hypothetical protein
MTGDDATRRAEDIGGQERSYAEVKAIASGNPAVLTLAEADAKLQLDVCRGRYLKLALFGAIPDSNLARGARRRGWPIP